MSPQRPRTPARSVRIRDPLWEAAKETASLRGETVTDAIIRALEEYVAERGKPRKGP